MSLLERGNTRLAPLDTVGPNFVKFNGDISEPFYSRSKVESLLEAQRAEIRKQVLLEAADKLDAAFGGNAGIMFRRMAEGVE